MKRLRCHLVVFAAVAALVGPARSCGPDFPDAVFVLPEGPGGNYALFAGGRLGVPQPGYRTRHLVIAYNYLTQRPLNAAEQIQAVDADQHFTSPWSYEEDAKKTAPPSGLATWIAARAAFGPVDKFVPDDKLETDIYADYESTANCLDDAFATAARTLAARVAAYGKQDAAVTEWVRGQDKVFNNCDGGKPRTFYNQPPPPAPDPAARTPATLRGAPLWLQQDRAYQSAAAHFYATDYDAAVTGFRTIGADEASPWSPVSRYLVARALLRKVTMLGDHGQDTAADAVKAAAASAARATGLKQVRSELLALQGLPRMAPLRGAIDNLLDYVNIRLQPEQQAVTLAERLHGTDSSRFEQSLIDLTYLRTNQSDPTLPATPDTPGAGANDMLTWIDAVANANEATALSQWRKGHATAWLLAALMAANPGDAPAAELIAAARAVPPADPGYIAVTYHRLRLMPHDAATRAELLPVLAAVQTAQTTSTLNLFTSLAGASAPSLEEWLRAAGRVPAGETIWGETSDDTTDTSAVQEDVCGTKVAPNTTRLFDADAATALNLHFPLRLLAAAAESRTLPANLQFQVAQAAWARAVLLDQPAIARRMSPLLIHCRIAWKPVLTAYDGSATAADREANGLLALMRFASTEPSVREGEERRNGFAAYDEFRQNWWCSTVPDEGGSVDSDAVVMAKASADLPAKSKTGTPLPLFLTATDRREADAEVLALRKIPRASQYVGLRALAWYRAHPKDPRTPDILGEADRVIRNSCRNDPPYDPKTGKAVGNPTDLTLTANLAHAIFDVLQRAYPQSAWAKRYTTWE